MTFITSPLDGAIAHQLSEISSFAAQELAARIAAKCAVRAEIGYSNASCSTYVDVEDFCIRISDHDAMSYNREGDLFIGLEYGRRSTNSHFSLRLRAVYSVTEYEWDEDGEQIGEPVISYTDNEDADEAEFEGYSLDWSDLDDLLDQAAMKAAAHA